MKTPTFALVTLALAACAAGDANTTAPPAAAAEAWSDYMSDLDGTIDFLDTELLGEPRGELDRIADRAEQAAAGMSKGYGEWEQPHVPGFAGYARDAEAWLLKVAVEARQGRGELAAEAYRTGVAKHCNECHDAEAAARR